MPRYAMQSYLAMPMQSCHAMPCVWPSESLCHGMPFRARPKICHGMPRHAKQNFAIPCHALHGASLVKGRKTPSFEKNGNFRFFPLFHMRIYHLMMIRLQYVFAIVEEYYNVFQRSSLLINFDLFNHFVEMIFS